MSLVQNLTQFAPTPGLGQPIKGPQPSTFAVRIDPGSAAKGTTAALTIGVGSPLKIVSTQSATGTFEIIVDLAAPTETVFCVVPLSSVKQKYLPGQLINGFCPGNVLLLESTAAITAGALCAIGNTSATGGGPGITPVTDQLALYHVRALTAATAAQQPVQCRVEIGVIPSAINAMKVTTGTFAATSGAATVAQTAVTANSIILITLKTASTYTVPVQVATVTPGTGFTVSGGGASDASTYNYMVIN
jgi:hypothetical protein